MNEGFTIRKIPAQEYKVCHGCKYLITDPWVRGHKVVANNYYCNNINDTAKRLLFGGKGRQIHFNHEGDCITPDWCPYLKNKQ